MATKRPNNEPSSSGAPPAKKMLTQFDPIKIGSIYSLEDLDMKTLQFQNKKLTERIEQRRKCEDDLKRRIEQLEKRQTTDDAVLMIVNRYWNTLDEDVRVLLQRFDAETTDEAENENESSELTSFLTMLSTSDKVELEKQLYQRVEFSKRAIRKLLQAFDRLLQRNEKLHLSLAEKIDREEDKESEKKDDTKDTLKPKEEKSENGIKMEIDVKDIKEEKEGESSIKKEPTDSETDKLPAVDGVKKEEPDTKPVIAQEPTNADVKKEEKDETVKLSDAVKNELAELREENKRLHNLTTQLHQRHHETALKMSESQDKLMAAETELAELRNKSEDLQYDLESSAARVDKYDRHLAEAMQKLHSYEESTIIIEGGKSIAGVSKTRVDEIIHELEEQRELAQNRMTELEKLQEEHQDVCKQVEQLKMDLKTLPESVIVETTEYKCLQSQFSVLYNESMHLKTQLEDTRTLLQNSKTNHLRQIEQMESDELACQKQLRTEMIQLEDTLAQVRKEYEMLRIEFEQNLTANEQTGPINREMRNLIQSLQNHNQQLKKEVSRYKHRLKEAQTEIAKLKAEGATTEGKEEVAISQPTPKPEESMVIKRDDDEKEEVEIREKGKSDADIIKEIKSQLKKSQDSQKELKLLLDMYKSAPKEQKDKVQLMAAEKKAKQEIEDLKNHIRKMQEAERKEKRKLADDDAIRKIKKLEETIIELQKNLAAQKQREEALLNEMEVTGQAFEDMQEQNSRLIIQLREKDDANFKLMSERIKANQIQKLLREEKDILAEQVATCQSQVEAQNLVVRKLEDKERILQTNMATVEKELSLRQQAMEMHKRKALESAQTAADLKLHLDKYQSQLKEAQIAVADKTGALEQESFKHKRIQEEVARLQRKLERQKKIEITGAADEVLMEEIKEYKEQLTCPSCKVKRKDAVLTKCFHVFCLECLKTRYETRQRKCPKCNAPFGANDYHRLFLS